MLLRVHSGLLGSLVTVCEDGTVVTISVRTKVKTDEGKLPGKTEAFLTCHYDKTTYLRMGFFAIFDPRDVLIILLRCIPRALNEQYREHLSEVSSTLRRWSMNLQCPP